MAGDTVTVDLPLTLHIDAAPDDKLVQAAMYGPLVLAARLGTEGLTNTMIYGREGPHDEGYPLPTVDMRIHPHRSANGERVPATPVQADEVWFERIEGSRQYPLQFHTRGRGPIHTLVPLNRIMDERYSVYLRRIDTV
jgi:uncharacterized protein